MSDRDLTHAFAFGAMIGFISRTDTNTIDEGLIEMCWDIGEKMTAEGLKRGHVHNAGATKRRPKPERPE